MRLKNMKPIILLDVDGCLISSNNRILDHLNSKYGTSYKYDEIVDFSYPNITDPEHKAEIYRFWSTDAYTGRGPNPGALEALEDLREVGRVLALTSPMDSTDHITGKWKWLREVCSFDCKDIIITPTKNLVFGHYFVDDHITNLTGWHDSWYQMPIVLDRPWNRYSKDPNIIRALDWREVVDIIKGDIDDS